MLAKKEKSKNIKRSRLSPLVRELIFVSVILVFLLLFATLEHCLQSFMVQSVLEILGMSFYNLIFLFTAALVGSHFANRKSRILFYLSCGLMMAGTSLKSLRLSFLSLIPVASRYAFYCEYILYLFLPVLGLMQFLLFYFPKKSRNIVIASILITISLLFFLVIFTNDLHFWVYSYPNGLNDPDSRKRETLFYFILAYIGLLFVSCCLVGILGALHTKAVKNPLKIWLPVVVGVLWATYFLLYFLGVWKKADFLTDKTVLFCLFYFLFFRSFVLCHAMPLNQRNLLIFSSSHHCFLMLDKDLKEAYVSSRASQLSREEKEQLVKEGRLVVGKESYKAFPVSGGYFIYAENNQELLETEQELESAHTKLKNAVTNLKKQKDKQNQSLNRAYIDSLNARLNVVSEQILTDAKSFYQGYNIYTEKEREDWVDLLLSYLKLLISYLYSNYTKDIGIDNYLLSLESNQKKLNNLGYSSQIKTQEISTLSPALAFSYTYFMYLAIQKVIKQGYSDFEIVLRKDNDKYLFDFSSSDPKKKNLSFTWEVKPWKTNP